MKKLSPGIFFLLFAFPVIAQIRCTNDSECKTMGPRARCVSQKTGCPGSETHSTCVIRVCDNTPVSTKFTADVKNCAKDTDCALILLTCQCMYCARPDDVKNRIADSINKKFLDLQNLYACTQTERNKCATAGACAQTGKSIPVCLNHSCTLKYEPHE